MKRGKLLTAAHEVATLRKALRWALEGNRLSDWILAKDEPLTYSDGGCGCCAQFGLAVPEELQPVIRRALYEVNDDRGAP